MRSEEFLKELNVDNVKGWGNTPNNQDVDYFGIRVQMKPTTFLKLAAELEVDDEARKKIEVMKAHSAKGGTFAAPTLYIHVNDGWMKNAYSGIPKVVMHEGRHRMNMQLETEGDIPCETHIFLRSDHGEWRGRMLVPGLMQNLNISIRSEDGVVIDGPLFKV